MKELLVQSIKQEAEQVDAVIRESLEQFRSELDPLLHEVLCYGLLGGGKRIRPFLTVTAAELCGKKDKGAYQLGCAFEYLHAATLFHDDIIDNSESRRGQPSVYAKYGQEVAILAGDFLHAHAMAVVGEYAGRSGLRIFSRATRGMVNGEFLQMRNAGSLSLSEDDYQQAISGKTGLLIAAACEVGAVYAGADADKQLALASYGNSLGTAYQLADDLLDYLGDPQKTGKSVGNDLNEGKMTLPLILALKKSQTREATRLRQILADAKKRQSGFTEVCSLMAETGAFEETRVRAEAACSQACAALSAFSEERHARARGLLMALAAFVVQREN